MIFGILSEILIGSYTYKDNRALIVKLIRALGGAVDATYYCFQKFHLKMNLRKNCHYIDD